MDRETIISIIITMVIFLIICFVVTATVVYAQTIEQLPIQGFCMRAAGNWIVYYPLIDVNVSVYNIKTKENVVIPGSEGCYEGMGRKVYPAIATNSNTSIVTWCHGNNTILYSIERGNQPWTEAMPIFEDSLGGADTNRSSVAINTNGSIMIVGQRDYKIDSRLINPDGFTNDYQTVFPQVSDSEATRPVVKSFGSKFYAAYTCDCGEGNAMQRQTIALSVWENGVWTSLHTFIIVGSPDSLDMAIGVDETVYIIATEYCSKNDEYCRVLLLSGKDGNYSEQVLFEQTKLGDATAYEQQQAQPLDSIAINPRSDLMVAWPFNSVADNNLRLQIKKAGGNWTTPEVVANRGYSALVCDANGIFSLYCLNEGSIQLRQYNLNPPTPTPTATAMFTMTATATPTRKPHSGGGCATLVFADETIEGEGSGDFFLSLLIGMGFIIMGIGTYQIRKKIGDTSEKK